MSQHLPASLDILIPTRDRPGRLMACLSSVCAQDVSRVGPQIRVFIQDNGTVSAMCDPDVVRHLDALAFRGVQSFYLRRPNSRGIYWVRKELLDASDGDLVCYLDDDVLLGPGVLASLWSGIVDHGFNLAAGLVVDVDALHEEPIALSGHRIREAVDWLVRRLESGEVRVVGDDWMELTEPIGACVMFRRADFEGVGGWDRMGPLFKDAGVGWAEDTAMCVALKGLGSAFVSIAQPVFHFTPRRRNFAGFGVPDAFKEFLVSAYGADYPERMGVNHPAASLNIAPVVERLRQHVRRCERLS